jgi:sulfur carrier protein
MKWREEMVVKVNGKEREVSGANVDELLQELNIARDNIAVELNKKIIYREEYQSTPIQQGDEVEIVGFVGGG